MSNVQMPAAFLGHGSPMNTLEQNRFTAAWRAFGAVGPEAAGDPGHLRALVHQRDRRHGDGAAEDDPRLLRLPRRSSTCSTRRRGCPSSRTRSPRWPSPPG